MAEQSNISRIGESSTVETQDGKTPSISPPKPGFSLASWLDYLFQDAHINSPKIKCFLFLFRLASFFEHRKKFPPYRVLYYLANTIYCMFADLFVGGAELPAGTPVGRNLTVHHGYGMVIAKEACLKDDVVLRQCVTIGNYVDRSGRLIGQPLIESGVEFGAGACVVGHLTVGRGAFIGANSVIFRDVPPESRVYPVRSIINSPVQEEGCAIAA